LVSRRTEGAAPTKQERLYYLDWLRVLAVLGIFVVHTLRPFDALGDWNIKNRVQSLVVSLIVGWGNEWGIPLLFVLAGAASWFALRSHTGRHFLRERSLRLLIPFVVGFLLLSPPQAYVEALTHGAFAGSFLQFVPWFFAHVQPSWHIVWISIYTYHLWFLAFLWLYSLLALPLFLSLRGAAGSRVLGTLAAWCARPGGILLFILPIALIQMALRGAFPAYTDWADFVSFFAFFLYGYLLFSQPSFAKAIHRHGPIALGIGLVCSLLMTVAFFAGPGLSWETSPSYTVGSLLYQLLRSINTWAWLIVIFSSGISYLNRNSRVLRSANEATLPFYVLHHPVIAVIAFYVVPWGMGILPKWLMLMTLSLALILAVYALLIRRVNAMRWLFGMKPRKPTPRQDGNGREQEEHQAASLGSKADEPVPLHTGREAPSGTVPAQSDEHAFTG
jgi:glucan biosynthesis protein C